MDTKENALGKILQALNVPEHEAQHYISQAHTLTGASLFEKVSFIAKSYVTAHIGETDLKNPTIEGESKKIYQLNSFALVELKPTMYSFTHNRYGIVEGTDAIRLDFWKLFATKLNLAACDKNSEFAKEVEELKKQGIIHEEYPFLSNYLGEASFGNTKYAIIRFAKDIPPLEIVWKNYLVGTMKHSLKQVDKKKTIAGLHIQYEGKLPHDIVRFDWRNPLPDKDECIPDEFAKLYIDTKSARKIARLASHMLNHILQQKGYELVDLCYFMNPEGNVIYSEITPDGMRIRKKGKSYDKDLWRLGKDSATITSVWKELYNDIGGAK